MLTVLENKLLELYRACPDENKFAILDTAQLLCDLSAPVPDPSAVPPASDLASRQIVSLFNGLSKEYRDKLIRYAMELTVLSLRASDPASAPAPDPAPVQTSTPAPDPEIVRAGQRMLQTAQKAEVPKLYQMVLGELCYLHDLTLKDGNEFAAICLAFDYGFVKGNRATRRGKCKNL